MILLIIGAIVSLLGLWLSSATEGFFSLAGIVVFIVGIAIILKSRKKI